MHARLFILEKNAALHGLIRHCTLIHFRKGSGYGYGTVPGDRRTIDTEGGHVVVSVSLMRNGYEYGTVPDRRVTIHTESGHVVNSVSRMRSLTSDDLDTPTFKGSILAYHVACIAVLYIYGRTFYTCSTSFHLTISDMAALLY